MTKLKPGDRVSCRIKDNSIVSAYREYDEIHTFEIISVSEYGYYLYIPQYIVIKNTVLIDKYKCRAYNIDTRFLGEQMTHISENLVYKVEQKMDGMCCVICKEFYQMAEANQEDGTLICWACRQNPYH
jgi:hypothetical protein